ncbi:unnamed protein product, partial [Chrysoparadoxa australica]
MQGRRMCSPADVSYLGDPMLRPVESTEIAWLVSLLVRLSQHLNQRFHLDQAAEDIGGTGELDAEYSSVPFDERPSEAIISGVRWQRMNAQGMVLGGGRQGWQAKVAVHLRRVNLRPLADYRNLLFGSAVLLVLKVVV